MADSTVVVSRLIATLHSAITKLEVEPPLAGRKTCPAFFVFARAGLTVQLMSECGPQPPLAALDSFIYGFFGFARA